MAPGANSVQLVINVVDANSGETITKVIRNLEGLGGAGDDASKKIAALQEQIDQLKAKLAGLDPSSVKKIGGHALTSLDNVRLLRDDFDIHLPRSIEKSIATSKALSTVVNGLGTGLIALGSIEIGFHVGKELYDFYDKLVDVNKEVRKYEEDAARASAQNLFASTDIETQLANLQKMNSEVDRWQQKVGHQQQAGVGGFLGDVGQRVSGGSNAWDYTGVGYIARFAKAGYDAYRDQQNPDSQLAQSLQRRDQGSEAIFTDQQKRTKELVQAQLNAKSASLTGWAAQAAEEDAKKTIAALEMSQTRALQDFQQRQYNSHVAEIRRSMPGKSAEEVNRQIAGLGPAPTTSPDAGLQKYNDAVFTAQQEASAKRATMARKENDEIAQMQAQAREAGLQGEAKYQRQREDLINTVARRVWEGELSGTAKMLNGELQFTGAAAKEAAAIKLKADADYQERLRNEYAETARIQSAAAGAGLTGLARGDQQLQTQIAGIQKEAPNFSDPNTGAQREAAARQASLAEQKKEMDDFADHIQQMDESRTNSSMTANQRIAAETARTIAEIKKTWDDLYGQLAANDARRVQGQAALDAEIAKINAAAADQQRQNAQQLADQTRKLQEEAMRGGGGDRYAEQYRSIEADLAEHLRAVEEMEAKARASNNAADLASLQQLEAQRQAYQQIAYNKELDLAKQQRDKLAGELRGYMTNPLEALKRQGEDIASKAAADLLMGNLPGKTGSNGQRPSGGMFDTAIFRPTFKRNGGMPGSTGSGGPMNTQAPHEAVVTANTATIHIGSAVIQGGGSAGAGSSAAQSFAGAATAGTPSAAVHAVARGGYASTGGGSFFNLGGSPATGGSSASAGLSSSPIAMPGYPDFGTATPQLPSGSVGAPYIPSGPVGMTSPDGSGGQNPAQLAQTISGGAKSTYAQANGVAGQLGMKGGLISKVPGLNKLSDTQLGQLGGTASGALGVFSAFEGKGGFGGALQGAASGFQMGSQFGGIAGGLVGAAIGGIAGVIGHGARVQAQKYWFKELMPKAEADMLTFGQGALDYQSAYNDFQSMESDAKQRTKQMGPGAVDYYNDTIKPRLDGYIQKLTREQKAGRSQVGMSAAQAHQGMWLSDFGSMATGPDTGWVHAKKNEIILNEQAAMSHGDIAMMMQSGASRSDIANYLGGGGEEKRSGDGAGGDTHYHIHTLDTQTAVDWLSRNVRSALNSSYAHNSGGAD